MRSAKHVALRNMLDDHMDNGRPPARIMHLVRSIGHKVDAMVDGLAADQMLDWHAVLADAITTEEHSPVSVTSHIQQAIEGQDAHEIRTEDLSLSIVLQAIRYYIDDILSQHSDAGLNHGFHGFMQKNNESKHILTCMNIFDIPYLSLLILASIFYVFSQCS